MPVLDDRSGRPIQRIRFWQGNLGDPAFRSGSIVFLINPDQIRALSLGVGPDDLEIGARTQVLVSHARGYYEYVTRLYGQRDARIVAETE